MDWNRYFAYEASSGNLIRKARPREDFKTLVDFASWNGRCAGKVVGAKNFSGTRNKSKRVQFDGRLWPAHAIIWEMHNGRLPRGMIVDHINGDAFDNRLHNLRLATSSQNNMNSAIQKNNRYGVKGVTKTESGKWLSVVLANGKRHYLGMFPTKGLAAVAYAKKSLQVHGEFSTFARKMMAKRASGTTLHSTSEKDAAELFNMATR